MAESGTEPELKEERKPSVHLLVGSSPEGPSNSHVMMSPGFASIKSEPQELDGTSRVGVQPDVKPIIIKPDSGDHGPVKIDNIHCGNNISHISPKIEDTSTSNAELMKWKTQRVVTLVPSILAKNPKFNGAKLKSISLLNDLPSQKGHVIRCRVNFSTAHKPVQLTTVLSVKSITGGYSGINRRLRNKYEGG